MYKLIISVGFFWGCLYGADSKTDCLVIKNIVAQPPSTEAIVETDMAFGPNYPEIDIGSQRPLAQGGMGKVFVIQHIGQRVYFDEKGNEISLLAKTSLIDPSEKTRAEANRASASSQEILRKARQQEEALEHEFLAWRRYLKGTVYEKVVQKVQDSKGQVYVTIPYFRQADGSPAPTLQDVLSGASGGRSSPGFEFLKLGRQDPTKLKELKEALIDELGRLHAAGVVHGDIKPSNILLRVLPDGKIDVKIVDFGLSFLKHDRDASWDMGDRRGRYQGTQEYADAETALGNTVSPQRDVSALSRSILKLDKEIGGGLLTAEEREVLKFEFAHDLPRLKALLKGATAPPKPLLRPKRFVDWLTGKPAEVSGREFVIKTFVDKYKELKESAVSGSAAKEEHSEAKLWEIKRHLFELGADAAPYVTYLKKNHPEMLTEILQDARRLLGWVFDHAEARRKYENWRREIVRQRELGNDIETPPWYLSESDLRGGGHWYVQHYEWRRKFEAWSDKNEAKLEPLGLSMFPSSSLGAPPNASRGWLASRLRPNSDLKYGLEEFIKLVEPKQNSSAR